MDNQNDHPGNAEQVVAGSYHHRQPSILDSQKA